MRDPKLLIKIANDASDQYLNSKFDMNKTITKEAEVNKLTNEEIQRVVEFANTKTYLELRKTASQNYVDFDVADTSKIVLTPVQEEKKVSPMINTHADYKKPPMAKAAELEKVAEVTEISFEKRAMNFVKNTSPSTEKALNDLENNISADSVDFDGRINKLSNSVRQILLQGGDSASVKSLFMMVDKSGTIWEQIVQKLSDEFPMTKSAEVIDKPVNPNHPLVKEAAEASYLLGRLIVNSVGHDLVKFAFDKEAEEIKEAGIRQAHPIVKGMGVVGLGGLLYGLGSQHATANELRDRLEYYNKLKPRVA